MGWHMSPFWTDGAWSWGWMVGGWLGMLLFWGAIIFLVVWAVRQFSAPREQLQSGPTPLEVVQRRYASGEITREQYEQMRRDLES